MLGSICKRIPCWFRLVFVPVRWVVQVVPFHVKSTPSDPTALAFLASMPNTPDNGFRRFGSAPTTSSHSSEDGVMWRRTAGQRKSRQHDDGNRRFRVHGRSSESHCYRMSPNRQLLKQHGARAQIDTPAHVVVGLLSPLPNTLRFPLFVKPPSGYASIGIEPTSQDHRRQPRWPSGFSSSCDCCGTASHPIEVMRTAR